MKIIQRKLDYFHGTRRLLALGTASPSLLVAGVGSSHRVALG